MQGNPTIDNLDQAVQNFSNIVSDAINTSTSTRDNSLYQLHKRITKKHTVIPPLHGPSGMAYSDFEKAEAFKDTLEVTFQENSEPYSDDKIEEVENLVNNYFDDFITLTPPLTSP
ncbi:uncharacterized protein TNCV_2871971 [Trichonephila clavipes]|nr:uncharacterized protein TNCV_2871971 [Trichonephila clavipes]